MEPYLFYGVVLPERAQLTLQFGLRFSHLASGVDAAAKVSILLNQVVVWIDSDYAWDIYDLRNVVVNIIQSNLAMVGYLRGFAYDCEITRVVNQSRNIDQVFGIDVPCLANRVKSEELGEALLRLRNKATGLHGVYIQRCFGDLVSAMRHADDTGFYCYRAIESLRHHCARLHRLTDEDKSKQWEKLREVSGSDEETLRMIKEAADPLRHGDFGSPESIDRASLFVNTWKVVDGYLNAV